MNEQHDNELERLRRWRKSLVDSAAELQEFIEDYLENRYPDPAVLEWLADHLKRESQ